MTQRYEVLVLSVPEITQDETKQLETELDRLIAGAKGSVLSFERWGKFKLTYPVRTNAYGVYFLARFEGPVDMVQPVDQLFKIKLHGFVMRHIISRVKGTSLEYQRPKSLEETPASRDMDTFLKENKMEGLLSSGDERDGGQRRGRGRVAHDSYEDVDDESAMAE